MGSEPVPEIFCDFNGRVKPGSYLLTRGTYDDLTALGLTVDAAIGRPFLFNGGEDTEDGVHSHIMRYGEIARDVTYKYLVVCTGDFFWRPIDTAV